MHTISSDLAAGAEGAVDRVFTVEPRGQVFGVVFVGNGSMEAGVQGVEDVEDMDVTLSGVGGYDIDAPGQREDDEYPTQWRVGCRLEKIVVLGGLVEKITVEGKISQGREGKRSVELHQQVKLNKLM